LFLLIVNEMSGQDKSNDAEEIFEEFEKTKAEREEKEKPAPEPQQESTEPEPQLESTEPEPQQESTEPEPQLESTEPEPQQESTEPEPQQESTEPEPQQESTEPEPQQEVSNEVKPTTVSSESTGGDTAIRDVIYVGTKPIMIYVNATLTQLSVIPTVTIKARGKRITQAVDVSQMIVKRMNSVGYQVSDVRIASESLTSQDGKTRKVSTMEIDVTKVKDN